MQAAFWLPHFQLQAALRAQAGLRSDMPLALLDELLGTRDKGRVLHASAAAERAGVRPGMAASQAQARCPRLVFIQRDLTAETAAQRELLEGAVLWTPDYESTLPGICLLDLSRARHLRGKEEASGLTMHEQLAQRRLDARVGFAINADLALLAAQAAEPVLVLRNDDEAAAFLHALPVAALRPSADMHDVLSLWGVRTLGDFVKLRRADVAARLGREGVMLWDMAAGGRERLLKLVRTPMGYREEHELEHAIECLEPLLFLLRRLLQKLCAHLAENWLVAAAARLTLRFDDKTQYHRELHIAEPTRDEEVLFRVLHTHLDGMSAAAPVVFVALELQPARPAGNQGQLFERALRDPNRFAETLSQLEALLGAGRVGKAKLLPSRRTDAFTLVPFAETPPPLIQTDATIKPLGLPLRRLRPAPSAKVTLASGKPIAFAQGRDQHTITAAEGPWFLSGDWWDPNTSWHKEVWAVQTENGPLYQLARQNDQWVVEGILG